MAYPQERDAAKVMKALGSAMLVETLSGSISESIDGLTSMVDGTAYFMSVYVPKTMLLTGCKFYQITNGNFTADNSNYLGLYSYSGGTLTQVAISANNANIWKAGANTLGSAAFSATYTAAPGLYYIAYLYNSSAQTTAPGLLNSTSLGGLVTSTLDFTNSAKLNASITGQTALASTYAMSTLTGTQFPFWGALY